MRPKKTGEEPKPEMKRLSGYSFSRTWVTQLKKVGWKGWLGRVGRVGEVGRDGLKTWLQHQVYKALLDKADEVTATASTEALLEQQ